MDIFHANLHKLLRKQAVTFLLFISLQIWFYLQIWDKHFLYELMHLNQKFKNRMTEQITMFIS
jgi:hypothetical protein